MGNALAKTGPVCCERNTTAIGHVCAACEAENRELTEAVYGPPKRRPLDDLVLVEDALQAMKDGFNRGQFVICHKVGAKQQAWAAWSTALNILKEYGTLRKAQNYMIREIEAYRN